MASSLSEGFLSTSLLTNGEMQNKNPRLGKMVEDMYSLFNALGMLVHFKITRSMI